MRPRFWPAYKRLLQQSAWPILVGPWRSEVGFEVLYWIPFVQSLGISPERIIPITRGGAAIWYGSTGGVELYDLREPKAVRIENALQHAKTGLLKQTRVTEFDKAVVKDAAKAVGLTKYHVLHPAWMYQVLEPFWAGTRGLEWVIPQLTRLETKDGQTVRAMTNVRPAALGDLQLPAGYCAARFYARSTFPHADVTIQCARECLKQITQSQPVVLLNPGVHADEHVDIPIKDLPNVYRLKDLVRVEPRTNLALQSAVLAGATGFVGTYGGVAQLALRLGKPSVSFYWDWTGTALAHKHLSEAIALQTGTAFLTLKLTDIPLLKAIAPDLAFHAASSQGQFQQGPPKDPPPQGPPPVSNHDDASKVRPISPISGSPG
jgi:hypothetical protein